MFQKYLDEFDLSTSTVHLRERGVAEATAVRHEVDPGLWTMALLHARDDRELHADVWEWHPAGDEVLCVLSGAVRVHVRERGAVEPSATLRDGQSVIVPAGTWHRLELVEPAWLLAVTPRLETRHEPVAPRPQSQEM